MRQVLIARLATEMETAAAHLREAGRIADQLKEMG